MEEKRRKTRVNFETEVTVRTEKSEIVVRNADSKNISMNGLFLATTEDIAPGTLCDVDIALTGLSKNVYLHIKGRVARKCPDGLGIEFKSIDLDSWHHLRNVVLYNATNPRDIEEETTSIK